MSRGRRLIFILALLAITVPLVYLSVPGTTFAAIGGITNGSFETGNFAGWHVSLAPNGTARVVTRFDFTVPQKGTYLAKQGKYFALLRNGQRDVWTVVSQPFRVTSILNTVSGWAFFKTFDYLPFNDESSVEITLNSGPRVVATLFRARVSTVGNFGGTPWTYWSYPVRPGGEYTIQARVTNRGDPNVPSYLGLDGVSITGIYPPPFRP